MPGLKNNEILASITWQPGEGGPPLAITMGLTNVSGATAHDICVLWQDSVMSNTDLLLHPDNLDDDYSFEKFKVLLMRGGVLTSDEIVDSSGGTRNVHSVPVRNCVNLKKVTGLAARRYRGRCFVPSGYLADTEVTEAGVITDDALANLQTLADNWWSRLSVTNSLHPAILHLKTAEAATAVSSFKIQRTVSTIRHRQQRN